jgi:pimeloyl-ACP methyl ester carboxylesterase
LLKEGEGGGFTWRFDPLHRTTSPTAFFAAVYREFAARVTCPVLFVGGGPMGFHPPDEAERLGAFRSWSRVDLDSGGHMMHWTLPVELGLALIQFFRADLTRQKT